MVGNLRHAFFAAADAKLNESLDQFVGSSEDSPALLSIPFDLTMTAMMNLPHDE